MDSSRPPIDETGSVRPGEELDVARLEQYLRPRLPDVEGNLTIEQFHRGHSNLTYLVRFGQQEFVLRRPPFGNTVKSAHDMGREYQVLSKLCEVYPPAPRPFIHCDETSVIGDEFYVMERRSGVVLRDGLPPTQLQSDPSMVRRLCEAFVDNLVLLHLLDYAQAGLGDLGRPDGYIERQVTGWNKRYASAKTDEFPDVERLGEWLAQNQPPDGPPSLIHNDYKYDNLMLSADDLTQIAAVLDWEMATVGDPLMDLGLALAYWIQEDDPQTQQGSAFGPTMLTGSLSRREIVSRYAQSSGRHLPDMLFYYCFGLFKLAVIIQQIYARFVRGVTSDARFAGMSDRVKSLGAVGMKAISAGEF